MTTAELREMMNIRREIDGMFTTCQGYVKDELDVITRKEHQENKEKIEEMNDTKGKVEAYLKIFKLKKPPPDLQSQGSASKGKGKVNWEYQCLELKSHKMDMKLEKILEDASMKSKEEEFNALRKQLKMCLLCFSIFPMDAEIVKKVLIYWWIGEGFVTAKEGKTAEEVGEDCFKELVEKEFIQPVYNRRRGNILRCKMHPWIRWMIIALSRKEEFFNLDESGIPSLSPSKSHHACLISKDEDGQLDEAFFLRESERYLLTLFNLNVTFLRLNFGVDSLPKLKRLVVLHLGNWRASDTHDHLNVEEHKIKDDSSHFIKIEETQTLDMLGSLVNLRYLSLRGISVITKLPSSMRALRNLEILDLKGCHNLEKLTDEIKWLKKLTHLDVSECSVLGYLPKELGSLSELEVIKGFVFGSHKSRNSCKVADLARLKKLRKLSINIWHGKVYGVDLHDLYKIKGLRSFAMAWSVPVFTSFSIPKNVVKLDLRCFPESDPPPWLNAFHLANLEKLYIWGGKLETFHIPEEKQEEKVWKIKMLRLKFLKEMKLETVDIQERFPHLEYLEVYECPNINLSDESYKRDSDGVWVNEKLEVSPASHQLAISLTLASDASKEPSTVPEGTPTIPAATTIASDASHTDHASTLEPSPTPASAITPLSSPSSASPTATQEHSPASPAHTNTQEASPAPATPTITREASLTSPAPTTTPEASPASAAPTTAQEASPSSAAPNTAQEASPASAAPTTIQEASLASATPTTAQEASPSSATLTTA
ncbi:disease resistance RPP13-like protein 4 [Magnolia sinica]|uniref:disease resistance RPP13-like protein 4 n=1 Tax=Magnolia sinica TaxID=86752 RepID=UPI00265A2A48|nr:disease resistance RPP13-like protein 4 [Magnolia sinica]